MKELDPKNKQFSLDEMKFFWQFLYNENLTKDKRFPQLLMLRGLMRQLFADKNWFKTNPNVPLLLFQLDKFNKTLNLLAISYDIPQKILADLLNGGTGIYELVENITDLPLVLDSYLPPDATLTKLAANKMPLEYILNFEMGCKHFDKEEVAEAIDYFTQALEYLSDTHELRIITFIQLFNALLKNKAYEQILTIMHENADYFKIAAHNPKIRFILASIWCGIGNHFYSSGASLKARTCYHQGFELAVSLRPPRTSPDEIELRLSINLFSYLVENYQAQEDIKEKIEIICKSLAYYQKYYLTNLAFIKNAKEDFIYSLKIIADFLAEKKYPIQLKYCYHLLQAFVQLDNDELSLETKFWVEFKLEVLHILEQLQQLNIDNAEKIIKEGYLLFFKYLNCSYQTNNGVFLDNINFGLSLAHTIIKTSENLFSINTNYHVTILQDILQYDISSCLNQTLRELGKLFANLNIQYPATFFEPILIGYLKKYQTNLYTLEAKDQMNWLKSIFSCLQLTEINASKKLFFCNIAAELLKKNNQIYNSSEEKFIVLNLIIRCCEFFCENSQPNFANDVLLKYIGLDFSDVNDDVSIPFANTLGYFAEYYYQEGKKQPLANSARDFFVLSERYFTYLFDICNENKSDSPQNSEIDFLTKYVEVLIATGKIEQTEMILSYYKKYQALDYVDTFIANCEKNLNDSKKEIQKISKLLSGIWFSRNSKNFAMEIVVENNEPVDTLPNVK